MSDVILVINAGSSSIKFSVFRKNRSNLVPGVRAQVEGLYTTGHFIPRHLMGLSKPRSPGMTTSRWDMTVRSTISLAIFGRILRMTVSPASGTGVVNGGLIYTQPVYVDGGISIMA